eukprot:ANDGO_07209.mRNA.1 hypothetical protein
MELTATTQQVKVNLVFIRRDTSSNKQYLVLGHTGARFRVESMEFHGYFGIKNAMNAGRAPFEAQFNETLQSLRLHEEYQIDCSFPHGLCSHQPEEFSVQVPDVIPEYKLFSASLVGFEALLPDPFSETRAVGVWFICVARRVQGPLAAFLQRDGRAVSEPLAKRSKPSSEIDQSVCFAQTSCSASSSDTRFVGSSTSQSSTESPELHSDPIIDGMGLSSPDELSHVGQQPASESESAEDESLPEDIIGELDVTQSDLESLPQAANFVSTFLDRVNSTLRLHKIGLHSDTEWVRQFLASLQFRLLKVREKDSGIEMRRFVCPPLHLNITTTTRGSLYVASRLESAFRSKKVIKKLRVCAWSFGNSRTRQLTISAMLFKRPT